MLAEKRRWNCLNWIQILVVGLACTLSACSEPVSTKPESDIGTMVDQRAPDQAIKPDHTQDAPDATVDLQPQSDQTAIDGGDGPYLPDGPGPCKASTGPATLSGTVNGKTLSATHAIVFEFIYSTTKDFLINFFNTAGTCSTVGSPVFSISLCSLKPGTYAIPSSIPGCALDNGVFVPGAAAATSGEVVITAYTPGCGGTVKGSFSATFGNNLVTGTFDEGVGNCGYPPDP